MLEAKLEAQELYSKIYGMTPVRGSVSMIEQDKDLSKSYAILLVEEKIKTCNKFYEKLSFPAEVKSDMGYICFKKELDYLNEVKEELKKLPLKSICAININVEEHIASGKLTHFAPELLKACQNALRDVKAMNEWMVEKGHHGYTLLERDLQEVLEKTKT